MNIFHSNFLEQNFTNIFAFVMLANILSFLVISIALRNKRIRFPDKSSVNILFEEGWVSGRSHKNLISKLGGGRNCIKVTVTDEELWINAPFPLNIIAYFYDGIQKIPLNSIQSSDIEGQSVIVEFKRGNGGLGVYELILKNKEQFINAIKMNS